MHIPVFMDILGHTCTAQHCHHNNEAVRLDVLYTTAFKSPACEVFFSSPTTFLIFHNDTNFGGRIGRG